MQWPGQKSDSIPAPPRLRSNLEEHRRNKIAIRGAKRRNNKGQVEPRVFPSSSRSSLYASFRGRRANFPSGARQVGKINGIPDGIQQGKVMLYSWGSLNALAHLRYVFITVTPLRYAVKSASVFRGSCGLIMAGWSVTTNRSFVVSQLGIYFKIRVLDREEEGWGWEKQREGKFPSANWKLNFVSSSTVPEITGSPPCLFQFIFSFGGVYTFLETLLI